MPAGPSTLRPRPCVREAALPAMMTGMSSARTGPPPERLEALLGTLRRTIAAAAARVTQAYRPEPRPARRKGEGDFVTDVDVGTEAFLREALLDAHPDTGFLGEESGAVRADAEFVWVVDPIDGTSNFAQGLPQWGVSVACVWRGDPVLAAVYVSPEAQTYLAIRGRGAWRGGEPLRVPAIDLDDASVLGVQWFRGAWEPGLLEPLTTSGARVRVLGSTVVQLCDVAVGRLHANVQSQGRTWDVAAAGLVVEEAGARFTDWLGRDVFPFADLLAERHYPSLAAPEPLHAALVARLAHA